MDAGALVHNSGAVLVALPVIALLIAAVLLLIDRSNRRRTQHGLRRTRN